MTADEATTKSVSFDGDQQQQQPNDASTMFDPASLLPTATKSSTPQPNRDATKAALYALLSETLRPTPCNVYGPGPLLVSDIPKSSLPPTSSTEKNTDNNNNGGGGGVIMGIDEAGRGPALGPMTYAAAYWHPTNVPTTSIPSDFNDSKQLSSEKRKSLFQQIQNHADIGFVLRILHASEISRNMLRSSPYNLNAMSHDVAISMIYAVLNSGVQIDTCYIDTVGIASAYQSKLERVFDGYNINFVVEKKADAKYAPCSAASVVAKESRDAIVEHWKWTESSSSISSSVVVGGGGAQQYIPVNGHEFGSGYPSDPKCVEWMKSNCNMDKPFGYPDFVRFSWGPTKKSLGEGDTTASGAAAGGGGGGGGLIVKWEADEDNDEDENGGKQQSMQSFVVTKKKVDGDGNNNDSRVALCPPQRKKARLAIFNELGVSKVVAFA